MLAHRPDVSVVDVRMPPTHTDEGIRAALVIRRQHPKIAVCVLSQYVEERYAVELLSGALSGAGCTGAAERPPGNALFILVVDPGAVGSLEAFQAEAAGLVEWVKSSAPVPKS